MRLSSAELRFLERAGTQFDDRIEVEAEARRGQQLQRFH